MDDIIVGGKPMENDSMGMVGAFSPRFSFSYKISMCAIFESLYRKLKGIELT